MNTAMIQFHLHEVTEADLGKEGLDDNKVGDILIYSSNVIDEKAIAAKYKNLTGHKVAAEEAGTGIFAEAKEGDLGVIVGDALFCSADKLSELVAKDQELAPSEVCEMSDDLLDSVAGGASDSIVCGRFRLWSKPM